MKKVTIAFCAALFLNTTTATASTLTLNQPEQKEPLTQGMIEIPTDCDSGGWRTIMIVGNKYQRHCPRLSFERALIGLPVNTINGFRGDENGELFLHPNEYYLKNAEERRANSLFPAG